jgi:nonsense-mediated mRNA decay protein 3
VRRRQQQRIWKLKRLDMEMDGENNIHKKGKKTNDEDTTKKDMKDFMDELEEDPDMRQNIQLFKVRQRCC